MQSKMIEKMYLHSIGDILDQYHPQDSLASTLQLIMRFAVPEGGVDGNIRSRRDPTNVQQSF